MKKIEYFTELYNEEGILDKMIMHYADGSSEEQEFITQAKNNDDKYDNIVEFIALWNEGQKKVNYINEQKTLMFF